VRDMLQASGATCPFMLPLEMALEMAIQPINGSHTAKLRAAMPDATHFTWWRMSAVAYRFNLG